MGSTIAMTLTLTDLRTLVAQRLGAETTADDVQQVCRRLFTLESLPKGQELSTALPPDL